MTTRRKHRLSVDVTFNRMMTRREAAKALAEALQRAGGAIGDNPVYYCEPALYVDKLVTVEARQTIVKFPPPMPWCEWCNLPPQPIGDDE